LVGYQDLGGKTAGGGAYDHELDFLVESKERKLVGGAITILKNMSSSMGRMTSYI